jgi:hypothetical protein
MQKKINLHLAEDGKGYFSNEGVPNTPLGALSSFDLQVLFGALWNHLIEYIEQWIERERFGAGKKELKVEKRYGKQSFFTRLAMVEYGMKENKQLLPVSTAGQWENYASLLRHVPPYVITETEFKMQVRVEPPSGQVIVLSSDGLQTRRTLTLAKTFPQSLAVFYFRLLVAIQGILQVPKVSRKRPASVLSPSSPESPILFG